MSLDWKTALRLGRVSNLPTVWTNVAAGMALASASWQWRLLVPLGLAMSALYVGGMYLNDAFDHRWDREHRPDRPIARELVSPRTVYGVGFALLALGIGAVAAMALAGLVPALAVGASVVLAALIVIYDLHHKNNPWSPLLMGLCRVGVYAVAATSVGHSSPRLALGSALLLGHLIGLTYIAKHETRGRVQRLWPVLMFLPAMGFGFLLPWPWWTLGALYTGHTLWTGCRPALGLGTRADPGRAVPSLIAGISLLDATIVASRSEVGPVVACLAAFALTRYWQRHVPGT